MNEAKKKTRRRYGAERSRWHGRALASHPLDGCEVLVLGCGVTSRQIVILEWCAMVTEAGRMQARYPQH